jgi:outer membrane protein TolC
MSFIPMSYALLVSIFIIFFILLFQFKKVKLSLLIMSTMLLGLPGASIGLWMMHYPFSLTAFIGITSLCGIVVRNGIILIDYLEELRASHGLSVKEAALAAGKRRMRPIFLTSAAASIGVIPMILSRSPLWGPLGTVVCFGLLISMVLTLFVLPVLYTLIYKDKKVIKKKRIPYSNFVNKSVTMMVVIMTIASFFPIDSQAQIHTLSIDSCKNLALQNNKKIKDADFDVKTSFETKKSAFTNYFPKISAMGVTMRSSDYLIKGTTPSMNLPVYDGNPANLATATQFAYVPGIPIEAMNYLNTVSISAIQPVFSGGRIVNGNKLAKIGYEVSQQKKLMSTTEVLVKTENIYWNTIALQEKLKTLNSYEKFLNQLLSDAQVSVKAGLAQRSDLLKVKLKLNELEINKMKLNNGVCLSKMALCQHIGIPYDSTIVLVQPEVSTDLPEQYIIDNNSAIKNRDEYQLLNKALEVEKLQKKMALGENLPQVAVGAMGYKYDIMNSTNSNALAFVTVSVPISDWWGGTHKIKEKQYKIEQASNKLSETTELLSLQIEQARNELNETYFQIKTNQVSIDQAKENLKVINDNYQAGVSSMSDLLEARAMYQEAQNQYTDAVCTYKIKEANYLSATGNYK